VARRHRWHLPQRRSRQRRLLEHGTQRLHARDDHDRQDQQAQRERSGEDRAPKAKESHEEREPENAVDDGRDAGEV
jgi:hypothetical protein